MRHRAFRMLSMSVPLAALAACGDGATAPAGDGPPRVAIVAGDQQAGLVGRELAAPIVVKVTDSRGRPISRLVNFVVAKGGGRMFAGTAMSNPNTGLATDYWTLGRTIGPGEHVVEVRAVDPISGEKFVYGTFTADGLALPAASLAATPGTLATHPQWTAPVVVKALDEEGTDVTKWKTIAWSTDDPTVATVDGAGIVTGRGVGGTTVRATVDGVTAAVPVSVTRADPAAVVIVDPPTTAFVGQPVQLVAKVLDARSNPLDGWPIVWEGADDAGRMDTSLPYDLSVRASVFTGADVLRATALVRVRWSPLERIEIAIEPASGLPGADRVLRMTGRSNAGLLAEFRPFTVASSDPTVATARVDGFSGPVAGAFVTTLAPGVTTFTVRTITGVEASIDYTVPDYAPDPYEPNDTQGRAWLLDPVAFGGSAQVAAATFHGPSDARDWFRVRLVDRDEGCVAKETQRLRGRVRLTNVPDGRSYLFIVRDAAGTELAHSSLTATSEAKVDYTGLCGVGDTRDLWVEVYRASGAPSAQPYTLTAWLEAQP